MKIKNLVLSFFAVAALASCKKDNFNYPEGTVGVSKIIYFPTIAIKGDHLIIINQGATFTDPGVTATLAGAAAQYTTSTTVTTTTGGIFNIVYTASNAQGYKATDWRTVVVIGNDVAANDFTGTYLRAATGVTSTWTKTASGVYSVENPGGAGVGAGLHVIAVNYAGTSIAIPKQDSPDYGIVSSASESYSTTPPATYKWVFFAGGYGTSSRTFVKQ